MYKSILGVLLFCSSAYAGEMIQIKPMASHRLGDVKLYHHNGTFNVVHNNKVHHVTDYNVDKNIRSIDGNTLSAVLNHGHIKLNQNDHGDFIIRSDIHGLGGGFATGKLFGIITKVGGYVGIGIACMVHHETALHAEELKHAVEAAALAAEAVGNALPTP